MKRTGDKRKSDITSLKEGFSDMLSKFQLEEKFDEQQLIHSWAEIMGKPLADRTESGGFSVISNQFSAKKDASLEFLLTTNY